MKWTIMCLIILFCAISSAGAELVAAQGFGTSENDTWTFQSEPAPNRQIWWGPSNQSVGGASAHSGEWYWASWDVDEQMHSLTFDSIELDDEYAYTLSFHYFSRNLYALTDVYRYCLEFDDGSQWSNWVNFEVNSNSWLEVRRIIPAYASHLRLKIEAQYNGIHKNLHWDTFELTRESPGIYPPVVSGVTANQRRDGSKLVDITYDLEDLNLNYSTVSLLISADSGLSYDYQPGSAHLSGDIGPNIIPGTGKHIVWNAGAEDIDFVGNQYRARVIADDHTLSGIVADPVISPNGGFFNAYPEVSISTYTPGASIYYTLDGSEPTLDSSPYTGPFIIQSSLTLSARAFKENMTSSAIVTAGFELAPIDLERFVYVPSGTFTMGRTVGEGYDNELPTHTVSLSAFFIGKYEVTQAEYQSLMGTVLGLTNGVGPEHPIYRVNWYSMLKYCNLRSMEENLQPVYSINGSSNPTDWGSIPFEPNAIWDAVLCDWEASGYRLPTEAEWEYAARGATNDPDFIYSGSNDAGAVGWHQGNSGGSTHPVGQKLPNGLGIYDMTGNVMEWLWDWLAADYYSYSPVESPTGPATGLYRVGRGGDWSLPATSIRLAYRSSAAPQYRHNNYGFRLCRKAAEQ